MTFIPQPDAFWALYLVNVLQPVSVEELTLETRRLWKSQNRSGDVEASISSSIDELVRARLVTPGENGLYAVTLLGLERLSIFQFGRIRDKNRLFLLKKRFKTR